MSQEIGEVLTLTQLREEHEEWLKHNFPRSSVAFSDLTDNTLGVTEEAGELSHAVLKWKQGIRGTPEEHWAKVFDAAGDIIVYLDGVIEEAREQLVREGLIERNQTQGYTLQDALEYVWAKVVKQRDWKKNPLDGSIPMDESSLS